MEVARYWRTEDMRYRLEGSVCLGCGKLMFPPRETCPSCSGSIGKKPSKGNLLTDEVDGEQKLVLQSTDK